VFSWCNIIYTVIEIDFVSWDQCNIIPRMNEIRFALTYHLKNFVRNKMLTKFRSWNFIK